MGKTKRTQSSQSAGPKRKRAKQTMAQKAVDADPQVNHRDQMVTAMAEIG